MALALALALMGFSIGTATLLSQQRASELRSRLKQINLESLTIADQFKDSLRELNSIMQRYGEKPNPATWNEFLDASRKLDAWIDAQKPKLTTDREKETLSKMEAAYLDYVKLANTLEDKIQSHADQKVLLEDYNPLRAASQRLFDLGQDLSKAHYELREQILAHADQTLHELAMLVLSSLGMLFLFGVGLAVVIYRDTIAPLRVKLVESQSVNERQEKLASLGMLAAGVAHEIRNPLTAVKAALFTQQRRLQPGSREQADAKIMEREILRLESIVNDFLKFARPTEPELRQVSADLPLRETQLLLQPQLAQSNIELVVEDSSPMWIKADSAQIKQVLINLVQNAAESIGRAGRITLRAREDRKHLENGETEVVILEVSDTGRGIPADVQKRLFDPFFTTKENGTGLGLSIASRIVQKHGGALQYQTHMNHGTTFGIVLPKIIHERRENFVN